MSDLKVVHPVNRGDNFAAVYKFTFDNGFFYIGGTKRIMSRIGQHKERISNETHAKSVLKASKGCLSMAFDILERIEDVSLLQNREDYYLKLYWGDPLLLNRAQSSKGGFKRTPEEINKHSIAALAVGYCPKRNLAIGISMRKRMIENPNCLQHLRDAAKKNPVASFKNGQHLKNFESYAEAERAYGLSKGSVNNIVVGFEKTAKGYSFKGVSEDGTFISPPVFEKFLNPGGKPVKILVMDAAGNPLFECRTISEATERTGVDGGAIHKVCIGKRKRSKGFIFKRLPN